MRAHLAGQGQKACLGKHCEAALTAARVFGTDGEGMLDQGLRVDAGPRKAIDELGVQQAVRQHLGEGASHSN